MGSLDPLRNRAARAQKTLLHLVVDEFDTAVEDDVINYTEVIDSLYHRHGGVHFQFKASSSFKMKPGADRLAFEVTAQSTDRPESSDPRRRFANGGAKSSPGCHPLPSELRPGSDIDTRGYELGPLGDSHFLALNKFPIYRPQLLILTSDAYQRQFQPLDETDLAAGHEMLDELGPNFLLMYNCGIESSCSRVHKHLHVIPCVSPEPGAPEGYHLWPDSTDEEFLSSLPFQYHITRFEKGLPGARELATTYQLHLEKLGLASHDVVVNDAYSTAPAKPHNVVVCSRWMLTIPRRNAKLDGLGPNAAGMLGLIWVSSDEMIRRWLERGPLEVLAHCGVPRSLRGH